MILFVNQGKYLGHLLLGIIFALFIASCSSVYSGKADIGSSLEYYNGKPDFTLNSISKITDEGKTEINLYLAIQENSLIFKSQLDSLLSRIQIGIDILSVNTPFAVNRSYQLLLGRDPNTKYYEQDTIYRQLKFGVPSGSYEVNLKITDLHTGKSNIVTQQVTVADPNSEETQLNEIQLTEISDNNIYTPINGYNINQGYDSLKVSFQVTIGKREQPTKVTTKLLKFSADREPARPMSGRNHKNYSLEKKGLDYTKSEVISSTIRTLNTPGNVTIENSFVNLSNGNYRVEVSIHEASEVLFEVRDFGIKSKNYPQVKSPRELAAPLYYLMNEGEYKAMMSTESPDSLKKMVDNFWLENIRNASKAKEIIRMYYDRVERANQQFGNFKEGWKTDPGMILILFGSPLYIDSGFGEMTWYYEFDTNMERRGFYFKDPRFGNNKFPFHNYQIERSKDNFSLEYRQIQSWRDGSIIYLSQR